MKRIKVRNLEDNTVSDWSMTDILDEINRDRSADWTDFDESDWRTGWNEFVENTESNYSLMDEDGNLLTPDYSIGGQIIAKAREIMKTDFMQYPDYDPSIPTFLCDAVTIILAEHLTDVSTNEIYDFLESKLK